MTRENEIIDDMAATLLDIVHEVEPGHKIARMAHEALERWKGGAPWPRLNNPNPPPRPIDF